jgi:hypothetical protein
LGGKVKQPANNRPLGPFARDRSLTTIDRRTKAGRVLRQVRADLTAQLGGDPSPAEALIIQSAAVKATRLFLMSEQILSGVNFSEGSDVHALAYLNSMRQDLTALGLKRVARDVSPKLEDILRDHAAKGEKTPEGVDLPSRPASLTPDLFPADLEAAE